MTMQGDGFGEGEHVVVRRPGLVRLAGLAIRATSATTRSQVRGDTMIRVVEAAGACGMDTEIHSEEPDGTHWSIKTTVREPAR